MTTDTSINIAYYSSPVGVIELQEENNSLTIVHFTEEAQMPSQTFTPSPVLQQTIHQLDEYFAGGRTKFDLPLSPQGTGFQQSVWKKLVEIPFGDTVTYMHMAIRLGDKKVIRAAASANGKNPIAIIIPCHRVIGTDGKLTGYAGGLHRKQWLLEHEAKYAGIPGLFTN